MSRWLDTTTERPIAIAICDRCKRKFKWTDLRPDPTFPGLMVCDEDYDQIDPYLLPPRETENISLEWSRPDAVVSDLSAIAQYANLIENIASWQPTLPWGAENAYSVGATVTPLSTDLSNTPEQYWFLCVGAGTSGAAAPNWSSKAGTFVDDGTVLWLCIGLFTATAETSVALPYNGLKTLAPVTPPEPYVPPPFGLANDGGVLQLLPPAAGYPTSPTGLAPGALWNNGGTVAVVPGLFVAGMPPLLFGSISSALLLVIGGAGLPLAPPKAGSLQLWNDGGLIAVA